MQIAVGWGLFLMGGALYVAQLISCIDFGLAQRIGIQEDPKKSDSILQRAERYTAYWDLVTLIWLPLAGILMLTDHTPWQLFALVGGAIYFDSAGREAAKILSFRNEGIRIGSDEQRKLFFASYVIMAILGAGVVVYSTNALVLRL